MVFPMTFFPGAPVFRMAVGRAADLVFLDRAQHTAGANLLDSVRLGDIPGVGMVLIDGVVRCQRSRNTPPATQVPIMLASP